MPRTNAGFSPRELQRRTFQHVSAQVFDQHAQAIAELSEAHRLTRTFLADVAARLERLDVACAGVVHRSFWGRLRWLVSGR